MWVVLVAVDDGVAEGGVGGRGVEFESQSLG